MADSKADLRARIRAARARAVGPSGTVGVADAAAGLLETARAAGLLHADGDGDGDQGTVGAVAIAAYIAAPGEPDVAGIRAAVRAAGGVVLLPIPRPDRSLDWAQDDGDYRPEGRYPIEVPAGEVIASGAQGLLARGVQTILVPALAVDESAVRLGQGGGYYDRLFADLARLTGVVADGTDRSAPRSAGHVRVVAVVRDEEVLPAGSVPFEAHDQLMTAALTPTRYVPLGR